MRIEAHKIGTAHRIAGQNKMEEAYRQDEIVRLRTVLERYKTREYYLKKILEAEEAHIPDHVDRRPRPDTKPKLKFTLASAVGLAGTMVRQLSP